MPYLNETINQHFISQAELRLNAINKNAAPQNQRIYQFKLVDRERCLLEPLSTRGVKINRSLCANDLFSFDTLRGEEKRYNFEKLFNQYEENIVKYSFSLVKKINQKKTNRKVDVTDEILNIFALKLLNTFRNPYCIKKTINTLSKLLNFSPTDKETYRVFTKILNGRKPHQKHLSKSLKISEQMYRHWLGALFLLMSDLEKNGGNIHERLIISLFEDKKLYTAITICSFDQKKCLISDRSYSIPLPEEAGTSWSFNLDSNTFLTYAFFELDKLVPNAPQNILDIAKSQKNIDCFFDFNNLFLLKKYHENLVYQCYEHVYCSSHNIYGINTV